MAQESALAGDGVGGALGDLDRVGAQAAPRTSRHLVVSTGTTPLSPAARGWSGLAM